MDLVDGLQTGLRMAMLVKNWISDEVFNRLFDILWNPFKIKFNTDEWVQINT